MSAVTAKSGRLGIQCHRCERRFWPRQFHEGMSLVRAFAGVQGWQFAWEPGVPKGAAILLDFCSPKCRGDLPEAERTTSAVPS